MYYRKIRVQIVTFLFLVTAFFLFVFENLLNKQSEKINNRYRFYTIFTNRNIEPLTEHLPI